MRAQYTIKGLGNMGNVTKNVGTSIIILRD
jgi:hypothetical protein